MWNMSDSDRRYYERKAYQEERKNKAVDKAKKRGEASVRWHQNNELTAETLVDFNAYMKQIDKDNS